MKAIRAKILSALVLSSIVVTTSAAVTLPKEGHFDTTYCLTGTGETMALTDKTLGGSYRLLATVQSNPPGGAFDGTAAECLGVYNTINGKTEENASCIGVDADGDKYLLRCSGDFKNGKCEAIAGIGKYEGMTLQGDYRVGPLPTAVPNHFFVCNNFTGTYKLK
jgi:hypothetical protein